MHRTSPSALRRPMLRAALVFCAALLAACGDDAPIETDAGPLDAGPADAERLDTGTPDTGPACADADGDGYASAACGGDDCDDADPARHPGATELCDGDDEDCDDTTLGDDADGDGFVASACCNGTRCGEDCDDARMDVNPRATETCNAGVDDDCDGLTDTADGVCVPCPGGYTGFDTDCVDVNECAVTDFCGVGATACTNLDGSFACTCAPGYATASTTGALCANVDECAATVNPCDPGLCVDSAGSYACLCPAGYRRAVTPTVRCADIDECAERTALCTDVPAATCMNTPGNYACLCPAGYEGDGRGETGCANVDECARGTDDCDDVPDVCGDTVGSFACTCPAGFSGDGRGPRGCLWTAPALSALGVGAGAVLGPAISATVDLYTVSLPPGATTTTISPAVTYPGNATITVDGVEVASGASVTVTAGSGFAPRIVRIVVTSDGGMTRTYTVAIGRGSRYLKASNTGAGDSFGVTIALSADGSTLAVGAPQEDSGAPALGGDPTTDTATDAGAVYVFRRAGDTWMQEALLKASNAGAGDGFGSSVALSVDGSVLAVGAYHEASNATGINGNQASNLLANAGAAYLFRRGPTGWAQDVYIKASNTGTNDAFGSGVTLSGDGDVLAVAAFSEFSNASGIDGDQSNNSAPGAGAVYVFRRTAGVWAQEAYVKGAPGYFMGEPQSFGFAIALSRDGNTLAASAPLGFREESGEGYVQVFRRASGVWSTSATLVAASPTFSFGTALAISADGTVLAVGAWQDADAGTDVAPSPSAGSAPGSGAAYVFHRDAAEVWTQEAFIKAPNADAGDNFGWSIAISADGNVLAVGASGEDSAATGIGGDATDDSAERAGAVYVLRRDAGGTWAHEAYVKAPNTDTEDIFGHGVALSGDGATLAVGALSEDSAATGIGGNMADDSAANAGAVYVY